MKGNYMRKDDFKRKDRKYDRFEKKESKFEEQPKEVVTEEPASNKDAIDTTMPTITLVNSRLQSPGGTTASQEFVVTDIALSPSAFVYAGHGESLVGPIMTSLINGFATARGYVTTLVANDINLYLTYAASMLANLLSLWRSQSASQIRTQDGINVGPAITDIVSQTYSTGNLYTQISRNVAPTLIQTEDDGISNAVWAQTYVAEIQNCRLPKSVVELIVKMYSVAYSFKPYSDMGSDSIFLIRPSGTASAITGFNTAVSNINALVASKPDLFSFLDFLGITNEHAIQLDFTRDLKGQTLNIIEDEKIVFALLNAKTFWGSDLTDSDVAQLFVDYQAEGTTAFDYTDVSNLDMNEGALTMLIRPEGGSPATPTLAGMSKVVSNTGTYLWQGADRIKCWIYSPSLYLQPTVSFTGTLADFVLLQSNFEHAQANWNRYIGINRPYSQVYDITGTGVLNNAISIIAPTDLVSEGSNVYFYSASDWIIVSGVLHLAVVFGATWRYDLQAKLNNLAKSPSNVRY